MAPNVPFALLGVVQLTSVAAWLGLAALASLPRLRRRSGVPLVAGALCLAVADALVALRFGESRSDTLGWLRVAGLGFIALAALAGPLVPRRRSTIGEAGVAGAAGVAGSAGVAGIVTPLGAGVVPSYAAGVLGLIAAVATLARVRQRGESGPEPSFVRWLALGLVLTGAAAALAHQASHHSGAALAELIVRGVATAALLAGEVLVARTALVGKLVGAIVAGVLAMAVGAVAVAGAGVASQVQAEQSARLLSVAHSQVTALASLETRAALNAQVVAVCPSIRKKCEQDLDVFASTPDFFAVLAQPGHGIKTVASSHTQLSSGELQAIEGSAVVQAALRPHASAKGVTGGPVLLLGKPEQLAIVAAVPGRPTGVSSVQVKPTFAAIYGIGLVGRYLATLRRQIGYDVSIVADGTVLASSLSGTARGQILSEAQHAKVSSADVGSSSVTAAAGHAPTAAFVPIAAAGNGNVRLATLVISQPAGEALAAQRSVLRRLVLTALVVLVLVALLAVVLAGRIADPVRRLTLAAGRVRRGDLDTTIAVNSQDEVGSLARAFDAMTSSLRSLTGDLREAAESEAALRARLERVIAAMTDGVIATDMAGLMTTANAEALRLLGLPIGDVVGQPLDLVVDARRADGSSMLPAVRLDADGELLRADGRQMPVRVAVAPLDDDGGLVVTLGDRSREREIERMKTEFLSNVSHELRTPLTPIKGYAELLSRRSGLEPAQIGRFAGEILISTERMNRVVALLVDVAALDAGRVVPMRRAVSVAALIDPAMETWRTRWPDRGEDLKRSVARGLPAVDVDPEWVTKALSELVDNAVKVTTAGSRITIRAEAVDSDGDVAAGVASVRVKVIDSGPGLDSSRLGELIGDFSQADASETRRIEGLGLGLGFVSRVCERFGLVMHVESRLGRGSEFALDLPVATASTPAYDGSAAGAHGANGAAPKPAARRRASSGRLRTRSKGRVQPVGRAPRNKGVE